MIGFAKGKILQQYDQDCNSETNLGQMNSYFVTESNDFSEKFIYQTKYIPDEVEHCHSFSSYLLELHNRRFTEFVRIFVFVLEFKKNSKIKPRKLPGDDQYKSEIKTILLTVKKLKYPKHIFFKSNQRSAIGV